MTAVVGPNGSGKSNISDGVRWVMGETSAKSLRGGSMRDVIFSGCDTRKASSQAEVTIELDNTNRFISKIDNDVVEITRRAHINGKSDFFINKQPARLKDIQEIFLDTGLGSSSYSMIGQEQTKKLLSEKKDERRAIFEEAAGIVKMKNQKETSEEQLKEVEQNFVRLNDILKELEKQVKPLYKQSEKAKQYLAIKEVLDVTESDFLSSKYQRLHKEEFDVLAGFSDKTEQLKSVNQKVNDTEEKLRTLKQNLKEINDEIFSVQESKSVIKERIESTQNSIKINEERIIQAEAELKEVKQEIKEIEEKFSVSVEEFSFKKGRFEELETLINNAKVQKETLAKELFHLQFLLNSSKEKTEKLREDIATLYNEYQETKLKFEQQRRDEERYLQDIDDIKAKKQTTQEKLLAAKKAFNEITEKLKENNKHIKELNTIFQSNMDNVSSRQELLDKENVKISQVETALTREKVTLDSLESSFENYNGYYEGVKNVLKNKDKMDGVIDVVSNLFNFETGYEAALDSLLSAVAQNIIVDSIESAKRAVKFLKKNKLGRATFIPLDDLSPRFFTDQELNIINKNPDISPALSVVKCEKELTPLFQHLLGKYLIATNMDAAVAFYQNTRIKTKIVTLDGDILQPGVISGGTKNKKGLISKRKELDLLKESIKTNSYNLQIMRSNVKEMLATIQRLSSQKDALLTDLEAERESNRQIQLEINIADREIQQLQANMKEEDVAEKDLGYRYEESKRFSSTLFSRLQEKERHHQRKNEELTDLLQEIKASEVQVNEKSQLQTNNLIELERLEEEKRNLTEFINEQESGKETFQKRIEYLQAKKASNEYKISSNTEENTQYEKQLKEHTESFNQLEASLSNLQMEQKEIQFKLDHNEESVISFRDMLSNLKEEVHNLELLKTNYTNEKAQILKRAQEAYQLTDNDLMKPVLRQINEAATEKEIKSLVKELKEIGSVNLESIRDYDELNERYQREKAQFEDVKEAKKDLEALLKEISKEMAERFISTFKDVAKYFERTFVELFGGGKAKLNLEDSRSPLTSHILITVQPPGKKPKKIELLSGGEKNLTVCALIFAIIKAKPSPFVYLDEIDAPLDDANVSRFAFYLKQFGEQTQFIVVTHRKGTMMAADSLYGVTQEEQGVTTVFPYHLEQSGRSEDSEDDSEVVL